jgi:uncharacterized protein (DUF1684 family)
VTESQDLLGLTEPESFLDLLDYRRRVFALYDWVRYHYPAAPERAHARWRRVRALLVGRHRQSPLDPQQRAAFAGLRYFPYDPALAFAARLEPASGAVTLPASTGAAPPFVRAGVVRLPIGTLEVYWLTGYGGGLFLPFRDGTSGRDTYGGGRYLLDTVKGADLGVDGQGRLILDFNFAYHPSCHFNPKWPCPLSPAANRLRVPVEAGERAYPGATG